MEDVNVAVESTTKTSKVKPEECITLESTLNKSKVVPEEYKRPFQCSICRVRFGSQENLDSHKIIHQSDGIIKCSICEKHFDNVQGLLIRTITSTSFLL